MRSGATALFVFVVAIAATAWQAARQSPAAEARVRTAQDEFDFRLE
jgi:hypothetical protein